jgi:hypothetical protein
MDLKKLVYLENLTQAEAQAKAKELNGRILTNKEIDEFLQQKLVTLRSELFPVWTGTHLDYDGSSCKITENGKSAKATIPEKEGWYEQDKFGLPFGKPSSDSNPGARYFWRLDKNCGLVARSYGRWYGWNRRDVDAGCGPNHRLGVFVLLPEKSGEQK